MRKVKCSGFEGIDGVVGVGGDKDARVDIHEAGAQLDTVEAGHIDVEEEDVYGAGEQEIECLAGVVAVRGDPDKRVFAQVCGDSKAVNFLIVGDEAGKF